MTDTTVRAAGDPFGGDVRERLWRRLAGAGLAVTLAAGGFTLGTTELLPFVTIGALVVYVLGVPTSWAIVRRGRAPILRHAVAGAGVGMIAAMIMSLVGASFAWWPLYALYAVAVGAPVAALAAWFGLVLPGAWIRPVALVGLLVTAVALPIGTWLERRPPAPHDFVIVHDPPAMMHHVADAYALAEEIAARFERLAAEGYDRTAHATWVVVSQELGEGELSGVASWIRLTTDERLPTLRSSGEAVRLVTTILDGDPRRGCVVVTDDD